MSVSTPGCEVTIRLSGPPAAVALVAALLQKDQAFEVADESTDYRNARSEGVRRYLTALVPGGRRHG